MDKTDITVAVIIILPLILLAVIFVTPGGVINEGSVLGAVSETDFRIIVRDSQGVGRYMVLSKGDFDIPSPFAKVCVAFYRDAFSLRYNDPIIIAVSDNVHEPVC